MVALVLPSECGTPVVERLKDLPNVSIVYGDVTDFAVVKTCVDRADYVLHLGGLVSPTADDHPEQAWRVNVGGARAIIQAVQSQPEPAAVGVVMVGSVAQTGDRNPPHHWGRVGDPLQPARFDEYAQTKIVVERELVDSGLPRWAFLRQTGVFYPELLQMRDAIMTHVPFAGVMEWVSVEDAARLLANLCEDGCPPEFWGRVHNVGGGADWRLTNWEFLERTTRAVGIRDMRRWYERRWFATRNFHGSWFTDSDHLQSLVPFRQDTFDVALQRALDAAPHHFRWAGMVPGWVAKQLIMRPLTQHARGTMSWIEQGDAERIHAFFGSLDEWEAIGSWRSFVPPDPDRTPTFLDHGYDESRPPATWTISDMQTVADFRGGEVASLRMAVGDATAPLRWRCGAGHAFAGSPRLILTAGHWCPHCVRDTAGYAAQARRNRFLAQVCSAAAPIES